MLALASAMLLALPAPPPPEITSGPADGSRVTTSRLAFAFQAKGAVGFECKIGSRLTRYEPCDKGTYVRSGFTPGSYTFSVRAYDEGRDGIKQYGLATERTFEITAIDDDGDGSAVPADCDDANPTIHPGAADVPGNGIDENCDGADAQPPAATPEPVTPAAPAPTPEPTPAPAPAAQPKPKLSFTLTYFMRATKRDTRFSTLSLKGVPSGATIKVTCKGGCPRKTATITGKRGTVALTAFRNKALRAGAKLTIQVTKPSTLGMAKVVTIRASKRPTIVTKTLR